MRQTARSDNGGWPTIFRRRASPPLHREAKYGYPARDFSARNANGGILNARLVLPDPAFTCWLPHSPTPRPAATTM